MTEQRDPVPSAPFGSLPRLRRHRMDDLQRSLVVDVLYERSRIGSANTRNFIVLSLLAPGILMGSFAASYALLIAAAMTYPNRTVVPLIPPIPMKMKTLVIVFGCLALFLAVLSSNIASLAHLGGMIGGYLTLRYWRGLSPFSQRRR